MNANAEVVSIGSELLLGQILDTNTSWIAKKLAEAGVELVRTSTVGDNFNLITEIIREAIGRSHVVITTGGIGPTEDDLTREAVAEALNRPLQFQPQLMEQIEALFKRRGFKMAENNRKQAFIPEGGIPIENPKGTAPGFIVEYSNGAVISIPGVPAEMEYLMEASVLPYLRKRFQLESQIIQYKVLRACGLGESAIGLQIKDLMKQGQNPSVGTLASIGDIKIRITAKADNPFEASSLIETTESKIRERLGYLIYGEGDETLQGNVMREMEKQNVTLSVIETFTSGIISQKLSGTGSLSFIRGLILPTERSRSGFLNISEDEVRKLEQNPKNLADRLSERAKKEFKTTLGFAVHGQMLEEQGREEHRMETFYSLSAENEMEMVEHSLGGELWMVRERTAIIALDMLRKYLMKIKQRA
jgi:nicotinamide-nucleotide amidase